MQNIDAVRNISLILPTLYGSFYSLPFHIWFPIGTNGVSYNLALIFVALKGLLFSDNFSTQLIGFLNSKGVSCQIRHVEGWNLNVLIGQNTKQCSFLQDFSWKHIVWQRRLINLFDLGSVFFNVSALGHSQVEGSQEVAFPLTKLIKKFLTFWHSD